MGRDTYIIKHNGGLCHERELNFIQSTRYPSPIRHTTPAPLKEATAIKYISDDSGGNHAPGVQSTTQSF
jgi:hypothetical protein